MSEREWHLYLADMLQYTEGFDQERFVASRYEIEAIQLFR